MSALRSPANDRDDVSPFVHIAVPARDAVALIAEARDARKARAEALRADRRARHAVEGLDPHWRRPQEPRPGGER